MPGKNLILHAMPNYLLLLSFKTVAIAQLVRASDCGSEGRGFEPHWLPNTKKPSAYRRFFIFILYTIHQKALLKGTRRKKTHPFALFLRYYKADI